MQEQDFYKMEVIYSPDHYMSENGLEAFDVMNGFIGDLAGMDAFYWCNIVKYVLRYQKKKF